MDRAVNMLVADDERLIQELFAEAVRDLSFAVRLTLTDNGRECLTLLNSGHIDLAFVDIHMPELSGMEAIWVARKQGNETFICLMSGSALPNVLEAAHKLRAYEYLAKPFSIDDIVALVNNYARVSTPMKVLVVDDSSTVRDVMQKVIQQSVFTCEITEAADAAAAIDACNRQSFDTALLDCSLAGIDGLTTLRKLRSMHPDMKIVMLAAERDERRERDARAYGAHGFLYKPFYPENVDRILHAVHRLRVPALIQPPTQLRA